MSLRLCLIVILAVVVNAQLPLTLKKKTKPVKVYIANIKPFSKYSKVIGKVMVLANNVAGTISYSGFATNTEAGMLGYNCTVVGGCEAKLTNGKGCSSLAVQGTSMFVSPIVADPWATEKYNSDMYGQATFGGSLSIGTSKVIGKPFISKLNVY